MKRSTIFTVFTVLCINSVPSLSSICRKGEDQFVILNQYTNKVYADGKEITNSTVVAVYHNFFHITAFCLPSKTRLIAVTNLLEKYSGAFLFGSIQGKLVTNKEWSCVEKTSDEDWYQVKYDDRKWPQAHANDAPAVVPNISQNALSISGSSVASKKYYCRIWVGGRPLKQSTRSAYASKSGRKERLHSHVIQSFLVNNIFECVTHCLDYEQCVSMNLGNSENGQDELKKCELNSGVKSNFPDDIIINDGFDYYNIVKP